MKGMLFQIQSYEMLNICDHDINSNVYTHVTCHVINSKLCPILPMSIVMSTVTVATKWRAVFTGSMVAGYTTEYVNSVLEHIANGDPTGGLDLDWPGFLWI